MAFSFLLPITAPMPVRPATSLSSLAMHAKRTRFSPAGPIVRDTRARVADLGEDRVLHLAGDLAPEVRGVADLDRRPR